MKKFFRKIYDGWMVFAHKLGVVQSAILLFIIYFIGIGITSIFCRLFGQDLLDKKMKDKPSFWHDRDFVQPTLEGSQKQF